MAEIDPNQANRWDEFEDYSGPIADLNYYLEWDGSDEDEASEDGEDSADGGPEGEEENIHAEEDVADGTHGRGRGLAGRGGIGGREHGGIGARGRTRLGLAGRGHDGRALAGRGPAGCGHAGRADSVCGRAGRHVRGRGHGTSDVSGNDVAERVRWRLGLAGHGIGSGRGHYGRGSGEHADLQHGNGEHAYVQHGNGEHADNEHGQGDQGDNQHHDQYPEFRTRRWHPDPVKRQIYAMLLVRSGPDILRRGVSASVAADMGVSQRVVQRVWEDGHCLGGVNAVGNKKVNRCGRKRIEINLDDISAIPLKKRTTLRDHANELKVSKSTIAQEV